MPSALRYGVVVVASLLALPACSGEIGGGGGGGVDSGGPPGPPVIQLPDGATIPIPGADGGAVEGCPVGTEAVQASILVPRCGSCHSASSPQGGLDLTSPNVAARLVDVRAASCAGQVLVVPNQPERSYFFRKVIDNMPACGARMPLAEPLSTLEVACLRVWLAAGTPATPADAGPPPVLSDASVWMPTPGTTPECIPGPTPNEEMCPGSDCISCHRAGGMADEAEVRWTVAGTVFAGGPTAPVTAGLNNARVRITDAMGMVLDLPTNSAGNFFTRAPVRFPLMAEVIQGTRSARMPIPAANGSCNNCHTLPSAGGAAGRIYLGAM